MTCNFYRPAIFDSRGNMRERVSILASNTKMPKNVLEKRIFNAGLKVIEENIEQGNFDVLFSDELRNLSCGDEQNRNQ